MKRLMTALVFTLVLASPVGAQTLISMSASTTGDRLLRGEAGAYDLGLSVGRQIGSVMSAGVRVSSRRSIFERDGFELYTLRPAPFVGIRLSSVLSVGYSMSPFTTELVAGHRYIPHRVSVNFSIPYGLGFTVSWAGWLGDRMIDVGGDIIAPFDGKLLGGDVMAGVSVPLVGF